MKGVLPLIIICCVGIVVCIGLLLWILIKYLRRRFRKTTEEFELDESTLTIKLDKKDLRK